MIKPILLLFILLNFPVTFAQAQQEKFIVILEGGIGQGGIDKLRQKGLLMELANTAVPKYCEGHLTIGTRDGSHFNKVTDVYLKHQTSGIKVLPIALTPNGQPDGENLVERVTETTYIYASAFACLIELIDMGLVGVNLSLTVLSHNNKVFFDEIVYFAIEKWIEVSSSRGVVISKAMENSGLFNHFMRSNGQSEQKDSLKESLLGSSFGIPMIDSLLCSKTIPHAYCILGRTNNPQTPYYKHPGMLDVFYGSENYVAFPYEAAEEGNSFIAPVFLAKYLNGDIKMRKQKLFGSRDGEKWDEYNVFVTDEY